MAEIENIFLTYANNSLKKNPQTLLDILEEFGNQGFEFAWMDQERLRRIAKFFIALVNSDDEKRVRRIRTKKPPAHFAARRIDFEIAFEAIYGSENGACDRCLEYLARSDWFGAELFRGDNRLKCYECDQLFFTQVLTGIVEGKEYDEIGPRECPRAGLANSLLRAYSHVEIITDVAPSPCNSHSRQTLKERMFYKSEALHSRGKNREGFFSSVFLDSIVMYSLSQFLLNNDRRKLKRCPYCSKFFIARDIRRKRCYSDECRKAFERRKKQKQREEDPVRYY